MNITLHISHSKPFWYYDIFSLLCSKYYTQVFFHLNFTDDKTQCGYFLFLGDNIHSPLEHSGHWALQGNTNQMEKEKRDFQQDSPLLL